MKSNYRQDWKLDLRDFKSWRPPSDALKLFVIAVLVIGVFLRFVNLDRKVYWHDETLTSLRIFGHTETELVQQEFDGQLTTAAALQRYQQPSPDKHLGDTLTALAGNAEHPPLYYLMARFWAVLFGPSIAAMRSLTAILSLLALPCAYWLCLELFAWPLVGWLVIALIAIAPVHVLYAQEAREYSLWSVTILLSGATFLRAIRLQTRSSWGLYALSLALGFYAQLLTALIAVGHGLYLIFSPTLRTGKTLMAYLMASLAALIAFIPWAVIVVRSLTDIHAETAGVRVPLSFSDLLDDWFLNFNRVFLDHELGSANILFVVLAIAALGFLCRKAPRPIWLFVITLTGVTALALAIPDVITAGRTSTRIRYLIPSCLGLELAVAYFLAALITAPQVWRRRVGRSLTVLILSAGILGGILSAQTTVWWTKSVVRSGHYLPVADLINQSNYPLVISDNDPINILAFSRYLDPTVQLQLVQPPATIQIAETQGDLFLFDPSDPLRNSLVQTGRYHIYPVYNRKETVHLWKADRL